MKLSFRWYGEDDKVTLENIRQIPGMQSIVTAVYDVPVGEVWSRESIAKLKKQVEDAGLGFDVIESIPVHEDIKLGKPTRDKYIENYCENIRRVAEAGIKCICYNFMPVFDWTRTQLDHVLADGSTSLVYYQEQVDAVNPLNSDSDLTLPGWDSSYTREGLKAVVAEYNNLSEEDLWNNLQYFLERVIPVAAECDVNMAIHEDDPCWSIFGLPRIITCEENLDRFLKLVDDKHNGITLCTGSLGCSGKNDVVKMAAKYAAMGRIHFAHLRNVAVLDNGFEERAHLSSCGSLDMFGIVKALVDNGFDGYVRPDHGRMIWGDNPGYEGMLADDKSAWMKLEVKDAKSGKARVTVTPLDTEESGMDERTGYVFVFPKALYDKIAADPENKDYGLFVSTDSGEGMPALKELRYEYTESNLLMNFVQKKQKSSGGDEEEKAIEIISQYYENYGKTVECTEITGDEADFYKSEWQAAKVFTIKASECNSVRINVPFEVNSFIAELDKEDVTEQYCSATADGTTTAIDLWGCQDIESELTVVIRDALWQKVTVLLVRP